MITPGRKGFLGLGKKQPNQYEVELLQYTVIEIAYKPKAKISFEVGEIYKPKAKIVAKIEQTIESLIEAFKSDEINKQSAAMDTLYKIGKEAVAPLIAVL